MIHAQTEDRTRHLVQVGIHDLRVVVTQEDGFWFAQGLDIDYSAQGSSLEDLKDRFERGFYKTVDAHLDAFGDLRQFKIPAPQHEWEGYMATAPSQKELLSYSQVSVHEVDPSQGQLPIAGFAYMKVANEG